MTYIRFSVLSACIAVLTLVLALGCSGSSSPVSPADTAAQKADLVPVIGLSNADGVHSMVGMMGAYELHLDIDNMDAELVMKRDVAIGESYIVSGIGFFTQAPCTDCLKIKGLDVVFDDLGPAVKIEFDISHPFPPGNLAEPPTAFNRRDLDIFDVAMVIVPTDSTPVSYPLTGSSVYKNICAMADGFTTELARITGDNAACPYFLVIDDAEEGTNTNNKFAMGTSNVQFGTFFRESGKFDLYLTFGYGFGARKFQRLEPKYYIPEFNRKAAWKVEVEIPSGEEEPAMGNTWDDSDTTTEYPLTVKVYDWQQGAEVSTTTPYDDETDTSKVYAASNVSSVSCEIPGMYDSLKTEPNADSGTGAPDDPLIYTFNIANENALEEGMYFGLVKVLDERVPAGTVGTTDFAIDSPDGVALDQYTIPEFATYQTFPAIVVLGCGPITGEIISPDPCPDDLINGATIDFEVLASSDNDGDPIVLYEIDWDYDGETFNPADSNNTGVFNNVGPFEAPEPCDDNVPYSYTVAFRATDSCDPPNVEIFATCEVTIVECALIISIDEEPIPDDTVWFDVAVQSDSYVYVLADYQDYTGGNCYEDRTILRYDNDFDNMTVMVNRENDRGFAYHHICGNLWPDTDIPSRNYVVEIEDIAVTDDGIIASLHMGCSAAWRIVDDTFETINAIIWAAEGMETSQFSEGYDVAAGRLHPHGDQVAIGIIYAAGYPLDGLFGWVADDPMPSAAGYWNFGAGQTYHEQGFKVNMAVPASGDSSEVVYLLSSDTSARLVRHGPHSNVYPDHNVMVPEMAQTGSYGTDDGQFMGTLDVTMDSQNNIFTLEDHGGGTFRIQKFTYPALTWQYSHIWNDDGNPMRMDVDRGDDTIYMLCDDRIHVLMAQ